MEMNTRTPLRSGARGAHYYYLLPRWSDRNRLS